MEGIQERGKSSRIDSEGSDSNQVTRDTLQFSHDDPDVLDTFRDLDLQHAFHSENVGMFVVDGSAIIQPVAIRNHLLIIRHVFGMLLEAPMEIANMRNDVNDDLPIHDDLEAQYAMSRRVLRSHIDDHFIGPEGLPSGGFYPAWMGEIVGRKCS
jgi:hypothetical protein